MVRKGGRCEERAASGRLSAEALTLLILISLAGLLLRGAYILKTQIDTPVRADAAEYVQYASNLLEHGTYSKSRSETPAPDAFRSPGYPVLIAAAMWVGGAAKFMAIVQWVQVLLGAALIPLTFLLGRHFLPLWAALGAALLVALSPHLVTSTSYLLTETPTAFLLLLALVTWYHGTRDGGARSLVFSGLLFGLAYLFNETTAVAPAALLALCALRALRRRAAPWPRLAPQLLVVLPFALAPAGWMLRSRLVLEEGAPTGAQRAVATLSHGSYPDFVFRDPRYKYFPYREDPEQPAYGASLANFRRIFWSRFRERPGRYLSWYLLEKPCHLWSWSILQGQGDVFIYPVLTSLYHRVPAAEGTRWLMQRLHPFLALLMLAALLAGILPGVRRAARRDLLGTPLPLLAVLGAFTLAYSVFAPWPRYAIPLRPYLYLCALWPVSGLLALALRRRTAEEVETLGPPLESSVHPAHPAAPREGHSLDPVEPAGRSRVCP